MNFPGMPNVLSQAMSQLNPQQQQLFQQFAQGLQAQAKQHQHQQLQQQQQQQQLPQNQANHHHAVLAAALSSHNQKQQQQQQQQSAAVAAAAAIAAGGPKASASSLVGIQQQTAAAAALVAAGVQGRPAGVPPVGAAAAAANAAGAEAAARKGKKRKPLERSAPDKIALSIPESAAFNQLLSYQRKVDDLIQHKRSEIKEALHVPDHVKKLLRLYVFNTHSHQPSASASTNGTSSSSTSAAPLEPPSWTLYISGRVLDPEPSPMPPPTQHVAFGAVSHPGPGPATHPLPYGGFGPPPTAPLPSAPLPQTGPLGQPPVVPAQAGAAGQPPPLPGAPSTAHPPAGTGPGTKLAASFFFRRVQIQLDPQQYPENNLIVWEKAQHVGPFKDQLEVKRLGSQPCEVHVSIEIDWQPERYIVDARLAAVLHLQYETKARILKALWLYIKRLRLQDPKQPQQLNLPMELAQVLGTSSIHLSQVSERLAPLLTAMKPLEIKHTIKVQGPSPCLTHCYDVDVELPTAQASDHIADFIDKASKEQELEELDHKLSTIIQRINEHRRRRDFLLGFSHSPTDFINALVASQARDMRQGKSASGNDFEVERRTDLFRQPWAQEAVVKYLQKRLGRTG